MRALIAGPDGTPYAGGCFIFDIFFPAGQGREWGAGRVGQVAGEG